MVLPWESMRKFLPRSIKPVRRSILFFLQDAFDALLGRRDELTPPRRRLFVGGQEDFKSIGEEFLRYFRELGRLKPHERVLDVGCGIGRMAVPLTKYLDERGSYEGFDIVAEGITWCMKRITPKHPNFHFQLADVFNVKYNPRGTCKACEFHFPYESESFDFVFLTSVFTHMLPQDMEHYLCEVARAMRRGGRCLITFFLLNRESLELINLGKSTYDFRHEGRQFRTIDKATPESGVAYHEEFVRGLFEKCGLTIEEPIHFGSWCGRDDFLSYQDIIIALKQ